jgi:hypothetical protein
LLLPSLRCCHPYCRAYPQEKNLGLNFTTVKELYSIIDFVSASFGVCECQGQAAGPGRHAVHRLLAAGPCQRRAPDSLLRRQGRRAQPQTRPAGRAPALPLPSHSAGLAELALRCTSVPQVGISAYMALFPGAPVWDLENSIIYHDLEMSLMGVGRPPAFLHACL